MPADYLSASFLTLKVSSFAYGFLAYSALKVIVFGRDYSENKAEDALCD